ncbi:MAG: hypothetical protein ACE141_17430 [Bryobacteraceae bacterium]
MNVLIVCSGNTCQSPMAVALLAGLSCEANVPISIETAGLYPGRALARNAEAALGVCPSNAFSH